MPRIRARITPGATIRASIAQGGTIGASLDKARAPLYDGAYTVTPSGEAQTLPTSGYMLTQDVTVEAVNSEAKAYTVSASGAHTIEPSAGYSYLSEVDITVPAGSVRMNKPSLNKASGELRSQANVFEGWVKGSQAFGSALILDKQEAKTVTPSESEQTAVEQYRWTTGDVKVAAIPAQYIVPSGTKSIDANGTGIDVTQYASVDVAVPAPQPTLQTVTKSYTPSESAQSETITVSSGYDGIGEVDVSVGAISSTYVGSAIERRDSSDLIATGNLVNVPAGYYAENEGKSIASGSVTASATKSISGHTATVTPRETRSAGYVEPGASDGTAVTVTASELVSGDKAISANGSSIDVAEYATVSVSVPTFDALSWLGEGAELLQTYAKESTLLSSTSYNGWTPSTTAKTIKSGASLTAVAIDLENYDYLLRWQFYCEPVYGDGATNTARMVKVAQEIYQGIFRRPSTLANISSLTDSANVCQTINTPSLMDYYNNNSSHTFTWSASYGIYASATAATFASSSNLQTNLTPKRPSISARCSTTYFSTSNAGKVTQASTYLYTKGWLYRIKKSKSLGYNQYHNVCAIYGSGL